jgi:peptidyl-prolyl cis-trans isomerase C
VGGRRKKRGEAKRREAKRREEMRKSPSLLLFVSLLFFLWGCGQWGTGLPEHIIAQVNEEQISVEEFDREFKELILEPGKEAKGAELGDLKQAYLDQVIERKILVQEARRLGVKISHEELNQAISEIKMDYPGEGFGEKLGLKGTTLEEWENRLEEKLLAEKFIRGAFYPPEKVDEKEALQFYEDHRSSFQIAHKVRARQIVVADGEEAIQILKRLKKGESFEKLAKEKSLGPEKVQGGDLGYFSQGEKPTEFDSVFTMEVGAVSEVIKSPYGYHIFRLEEKTQPRQIPFEEAKLEIVQELGRKKGEENYQKWLNNLKGKANVRVNKKKLRS